MAPLLPVSPHSFADLVQLLTFGRQPTMSYIRYASAVFRPRSIPCLGDRACCMMHGWQGQRCSYGTDPSDEANRQKVRTMPFEMFYHCMVTPPPPAILVFL